MERFDDMDLESEFLDRACVMKSPSNFLRSMYRCAVRFALKLTGVGRAVIRWVSPEHGKCSSCCLDSCCINFRGEVRSRSHH